MNTRTTFLLLPVLLLGFSLRADPGALDPSFNTGTNLGTACCVAAFGVNSIVLQPDKMILVGGEFRGFSADNAARNFLARLDTNGVLDSSFDARLGTNSVGSVNVVLLQPDGKIFIGGGFTNINGVTCNRIARLNPDATLDGSFHPGTGADGSVYGAALQGDGKIVIGGMFANVNGTLRNRLARLNADGTLDVDFDPGTGANSTVATIAVQNDGKVLVGGGFTTINGTSRNRIARLNTNGSLDTIFAPSSGIDDGSGAGRRVLSIVMQPDGKILVGGWFASANGLPCTGIVRFESDGTTDTHFNVTCLHQSGLSGDLGFVNALALQRDGRIVVGGNFFAASGATNTGITRLNADGGLDTNFNPGASGSDIAAIAIQPDGKYVIGGEFTSFAGLARYHAARLDGDPTLRSIFTTRQIVLSWPISYTNFTLQHKPMLNPTSEWTATPNLPEVFDGQFVVTNLMDGESGFYRLKR